MTTAFVLGVLAMFGVLIRQYSKTHPIYKYKKTQKLKEIYVAKAIEALRNKGVHEEKNLYWLAKGIADDIFDFYAFRYLNPQVERYKREIELQKIVLHQYKVESPFALCEQLVKRAMDLEVSITRFSSHMRELWVLCLIPVGRLTPDSIGKISGSEEYVAALKAIEITDEEIENYLKSL